MIDVVELKYQVVEVERQKYVCGCGGAVETAPGPARAVEGGRYSLRFAIKVAFDKYVAHLPLERQARLMAHHGLIVTSQTLWDQCSAIMDLLEPTYDALFALLRASPVVGVDQTGWPDLEDSSLPPWQMWCVTAPGSSTTGFVTTSQRGPSRRCWVTTRDGSWPTRWGHTRPARESAEA